LGTNQHASTGCACGFAFGRANPQRRVEHEKEKYECRNQQLLCKAAAMQLHHERDQIVILAFGDRYQRREVVGRVLHVGIGEQQEPGIYIQRGIDSLLYSPQLS
jgi:hypothetical protein